MANYLDNLQTFTNRAQVVIAQQAKQLRVAYEIGGDYEQFMDNVNWYTQLLSGANDTTQDETLRLQLLTILVDNAKLNQVPDPVGVFDVVFTITPTVVSTVPFANITGSPLDNPQLVAQFAQYLQLAGGTLTGDLLMTAGTRIDSATAAPLNIGTVTATAINLGGVGIPINTGTIAQGVWNGTRIGVAYGGLGALDISSGTVGQSIRIASGGTSYEYYTPINGGDYLPLAGGTMTGNLLMTAGSTRIDTAVAGILNLGNVNATTINLGQVGTAINTGTIGVGVWEASPIPRTAGGFGNAMVNLPGDNYLYGFDNTDESSVYVAIGTNLVYTQYELALASTLTGVTLGSGSTWSGNTIATARGGTGLTTIGTALQYLRVNAGATGLEYATLTALTNPMTTSGDMIYGGAAGVATRLAGDTSNTKKFLTATSIAGVAQPPSWGVVTLNDLPVISLAKGGTGQALVNPAANRLLGWDNATSSMSFMVIGAGLSYVAATKTLSVDATGIVVSVSGTANRITSSGGSTPVIDIAATYVGQSSITTLGTITTGDWQAAIIDGEFGGTGLDVSTGTIGDSIRISALGEWEFYTPSGGGSGTVTTVSVVTANGFAGSVANATTTPAITLTTSVTGLLKGNGTAISAASAGTDYVAPGAITSSGLTMATARLLGRTTASTGAIEEISVGTGLTLSAGTLSASAAGTGNQSFTSQTSITVTHSRGYYPLVQVIDNSGNLLSPTSVVHGSTNAFTVTLASSTSGNIIYA